MDLRRFFLDKKVQARLNLNDEQIKKLQDLKVGTVLAYDAAHLIVGFRDYDLYKLNFEVESAELNLGPQKEIRRILTPEQQAKWKKMLGTPWPRRPGSFDD